MFYNEKLNLFWLILKTRSDKLLPGDQKQRLISDIESKLEERPKISNSFGNPRHSVNEVIVSNGMVPTNEYEQLRRRVRTNTGELYNFVNNELTKIWKKAKPYVPELGQYIDTVMALTTEHKHSLINDIDRLRKIDVSVEQTWWLAYFWPTWIR